MKFNIVLCLLFFNGVILAQNRVGVNIPNPEFTLDIRSSNNADASLFNLGSLDNSKFLRFFSGSDTYPDPVLTYPQGKSFIFATDENIFTERMRITNEGNLGIGIINPTAQLDVKGGDWNLDNGNPGDLRIGSESHNLRIGVATGGGGAGISRIYASNELRLGTGNTQHLIIKNDGNIGIGTSDPLHPLTLHTSEETGLYVNSTATENTYAIVGESSATSEFNVGVWGANSSPLGAGVYGQTYGGGSASGVIGSTWAPTGKGVLGVAVYSNDVNYGVYGVTTSPNGYGGYFEGGVGVEGKVSITDAEYALDVDGKVRIGSIEDTAYKLDIAGTYGIRSKVVNIYGSAIYAQNTFLGYGAYCETNGGTGAKGINIQTEGTGFGVIGESASTAGRGVYGYATHEDGNNYGVYGRTDSSDGYGGYFVGRLYSSGRAIFNNGIEVNNITVGDYANLQYNTNSGLFYYDNSSARYKENIVPLETDFEQILHAQPVMYTRPGNTERIEIGYIAEEMEALGLDHLIGYDKNGLVENYNYEKMILYVVEVLKKQDQELNDQELRFQKQEARIKKLEEALSSLLNE